MTAVEGHIVGYDLSETYGQISFYSKKEHEPQTMEVGTDQTQMPLVIGLKDDFWMIGNAAVRMKERKEGYVAEDLYRKAMQQERIVLGNRAYEAVWLLAKFIEISLQDFKPISRLVFSVPQMSVDVGKVLKGIGPRIGVDKSSITVQDYKESFFNYMFYQPKELWQYEAALFYCDRYEVKAYMLRKLRTGSGKGSNLFVTVDEVARAQMKELEAVYPVLNVDRAKDADAQFNQFIQGVFNKKIVSSVFLVGEGFENNWYPQSLKVLCNGRRAFMGNNLYSKGACYAGYRALMEDNEGPIYLDETKMTQQICLKLRIGGQEEWTPIVAWGSHWYESDKQLEVLLENTEDIEIHVESLLDSQVQVIKVPMGRLPQRKNYAIRLQIKVLFVEEKICRISFQDMGFGEFFAPTDFYEEVDIHLGGSNGQFNSLS